MHIRERICSANHIPGECNGSNFPWWIAGTAMVATTFAADTPLAVTELVARNDIAGNWLWWNMLIGGMLTVFFSAKLRRRAGILTDVEYQERRESYPSRCIISKQAVAGLSPTFHPLFPRVKNDDRGQR